MYNVSTEFNNKIKQNSRRIAGKLLLGNLELTPEDIINMNMEYSLGNDGIPAIGGVVASKLEVKLSRDKLPSVLTTQELKPYLGIKISPGVVEYVPMGVFRISPKDTKKTDKTISLIGYDILFILENSPYNSNLKFPNTWNSIKAELETKGLKFASQALTNVTIKEKPNTIRELLSDVSELLGMNVVTNKIGEIEFRQLNVVEFDLDANNYYDFKLLADDDVKLTRLTVEKEGEENKDLTYGDDTGYTIKIKNDSINTQSELRTAYDRIFPLNYITYECNMQGMPHVEVGDIINLTDRHGTKRSIPIAYHRLSYSGGLRSEIRANAPSGAISSTGSTGSNSITQSLNDLRVNILEVNTVLADKVSTNELDANVARIEKIINTNLESINAKIKIIETESLTAINADITALKGNVAEIDTILSKEVFVELASVGQIVAGSGIIADGAIGDAQISSLSASKLSAGIIDAAIITVKNLNADNITVGTINGQRIADGAIDNSKVAEGANIAGSKLDINDVIININSAETQIDGTKIQVGDRALDVELSTQKLAIDENSQEISNQRSEINALDDAIKFKVDNQTFNQYKVVTDENITTINTQLSKNTASIDVLQEEINLKVSQTDVEKLISNIEIGGRNLIPNSETEKMGSNLITYYFNVNDIIDNIGEELTLSFDVKKEVAGTHVIDCYLRDQGTNKVLNPKSEAYTIDESWQRIVYTFALQEDIKDVEKIAVGIRCNKYVPGGEGNEGNIIVKKVQLEEGNKATTWTSAPEDFETEIIAINTKVAKIDINLEGITSRVASTESNIVKVNDEVSAIESRVSTAERKITDNAIVDTVRSSAAYINDLDNKASQEDLNLATSKITTLEQTSENFKISINDYENGKLKGAYYNFTGEAAIFKGAGFVILDNNYTSVLQGDTEGNLSITGDFIAYRNAQKAIEMTRNSILMYDWEGTTRQTPVGTFFSARKEDDMRRPGIMMAHKNGAYMALGYEDPNNSSYKSYIDFDVENITNEPNFAPIRFYEPMIFYQNPIIRYGLTFWGDSQYRPVIFGSSTTLAFKCHQFEFSGIQGDKKILDFDSYAGAINSWYNHICRVNLQVRGDFKTFGAKNAIHQTKNYGDRAINSYETAEYYSGDLGSGKLGEDGLCYIVIDDIFGETINTNAQYHVFLQKYGQGDLWVKERTPRYFVIEGTPSLDFSWELKAKRDGYEYDRLEVSLDLNEEEEISINYLIEDEKEERKNEELKEILNGETTFDLADYVLGGEKIENIN